MPEVVLHGSHIVLHRVFLHDLDAGGTSETENKNFQGN